MEEKKLIKLFSGIVLVISLITLGLSVFYSTAFVPATMLMISLFIFGVCYYIKDDKKNILYILFVVGVLLIIASLVYTYLRLS